MAPVPEQCSFDSGHQSFGNHYANCLTQRLEKSIKLWKVKEKASKVLAELKPEDVTTRSGPGILRFPTMTARENVVMARPWKLFLNSHSYHINSISANCDNETFLSADDLRVNLWNLHVTNQSFSMDVPL